MLLLPIRRLIFFPFSFLAPATRAHTHYTLLIFPLLYSRCCRRHYLLPQTPLPFEAASPLRVRLMKYFPTYEIGHSLLNTHKHVRIFCVQACE